MIKCSFFITKILLLIFTFFVLNLSAQEVIFPSIISDHAVFQRNADVKLWGWCPSVWNVKIVCSWAPTDTVYTKPDKYSLWKAIIKTPNNVGPHTIRFYGWENKLFKEITDVVLGEVWLCSGQSNMEYCFRWRVADGGNDIEQLKHNNNIRIFKVPKSTSRTPLERVDGKWEIATPESLLDFSVAGFFFGNKLFQSLRCPVGLIGAYWGGTPIQTWIDSQTLAQNQSFIKNSEKIEANWAPTGNSCLYNAMVYPIIPYTMKGVVWYQGESNNEQYNEYADLFESMILGWRKQSQQDLPFYFVQIAPWSGYADNNGALLREQQMKVNNKVHSTGMVCVGDLVNDIHDIHPALKRQVGERLGNMALYKTYKMTNISPFSPVYRFSQIIGKKIYISTTAKKLKCKSSKIKHFQIMDSTGHLFDADAKLLKDGRICVVSSHVQHPSAVRYCFTNDAMPDLFDENGLPLMPFRTDNQE